MEGRLRSFSYSCEFDLSRVLAVGGPVSHHPGQRLPRRIGCVWPSSRWYWCHLLLAATESPKICARGGVWYIPHFSNMISRDFSGAVAGSLSGSISAFRYAEQTEQLSLQRCKLGLKGP